MLLATSKLLLSVAPFILPLMCGNHASILCLAVCMKSYRCTEGGQFHCGSDPPPEVESEPQQRWDSICLNGKARCADQGCVNLMVSTAKQIRHSSNKRSVPHFNPQTIFIWTNNCNVVSDSVFGNLHEEKKILQLYVAILSYPICPTGSSSHFYPKHGVCPPAAEPGSSYSWMVVIMWCNLEWKTLTQAAVVCMSKCPWA